MHKKISFQPDTEPSFTTDSFRASGGTCQESFTYDANLNLIAQHIQPTTMAGQNTDSIKIQNIQLTGRTIKNGDNWFKYDNQGRLIEKRVVENGFRPRTYFYHWNALNQLVRYITSQGDEWHYQYDAFGRRIRKFQVIHHDQQVDKRPRPSPLSQPKSQPKIGCEYYYLGDQLIEEAPIYTDGSVAFEHSTHWLYAPNQLTPTARYQQGELNYVITDQIGTPTELLSEDGTGRWRVKHNLWGSILKQYSANDDDYCNLRFPGQYLDNESGLHYNRHRYYDPNTAQYLTPDPIGLAGGFNPYGYVHNPTGWIDPLGLAEANCYSIQKLESKGFIDVEVTKNGGLDYSKSNALYNNPNRLKPDGTPTESIVQIKLTGDYQADELAANLRGFGQKSTPSLNGERYVWHHLDDYNPNTGIGTLQLVKQDAHLGVQHIGGASQYKEATGNAYTFKTW